MNAPALTVRVIVGASGAYACIEEGAHTMDVRLAPGRGTAQAMREAAEELRKRGEAMIRRADFIERAERAYTQPSLL